MELDELKTAWNQNLENADLNSAKDNSFAETVTKTGFRSGLKRIAYAEYTGILICLGGAAYIIWHFAILDTFFLQGTGILAIFLLLIVSLTSIVSVRQLSLPVDVQATYVTTLQKFANRKIQFNRLQKINLMLSHLLLVTVVILIFRFFIGKDISGNKYFWTSAFTLGYLFLVFYAKWVAGYYNRALNDATAMLKETAVD